MSKQLKIKTRKIRKLSLKRIYSDSSNWSFWTTEKSWHSIAQLGNRQQIWVKMLGCLPAFKGQVCLLCRRGLAWPMGLVAIGGRVTREGAGRVGADSLASTLHLPPSSSAPATSRCPDPGWVPPPSVAPSWAHQARPTTLTLSPAGLWADLGQSCRKMGTWRQVPRGGETAPPSPTPGTSQLSWAELVWSAEHWPSPVCWVLPHGSRLANLGSKTPQGCMSRGEQMLLVLLLNEESGSVTRGISWAVQDAGWVREDLRSLVSPGTCIASPTQAVNTGKPGQDSGLRPTAKAGQTANRYWFLLSALLYYFRGHGDNIFCGKKNNYEYIKLNTVKTADFVITQKMGSEKKQN